MIRLMVKNVAVMMGWFSMFSSCECIVLSSYLWGLWLLFWWFGSVCSVRVMGVFSTSNGGIIIEIIMWLSMCELKSM